MAAWHNWSQHLRRIKILKILDLNENIKNIKTNSARTNLSRFDRAQLDHELMIAIIGETTDDGEWTENGTVEDVK